MKKYVFMTWAYSPTFIPPPHCQKIRDLPPVSKYMILTTSLDCFFSSAPDETMDTIFYQLSAS